MNNDTFIKQTIDFLENSDLQLPLPLFDSFDAKSNIHYRSGICSSCYNKLFENPLLTSMITFSLLDSFVDFKYPDLEGENFKKKYMDLPKSEDNQIIFAEIYRVFKLIRNFITYQPMQAIKCISLGSVNISYNFRGTQFNLKCSNDVLKEIYSFVILYIELSELKKCNKLYSNAIFRNYYNRIESEVINFTDDISSSLVSINSSKLKLEQLGRRIAHNVQIDFDENNNLVKFHQIFENPLFSNITDYFIEYREKKYLIPFELLEEKKELSLDIFLEWEYVDEYPIFNRGEME